MVAANIAMIAPDRNAGFFANCSGKWFNCKNQNRRQWNRYAKEYPPIQPGTQAAVSKILPFLLFPGKLRRATLS